MTFEPGARTDWHTHPLGQTLIIVSGCGSVQSWGGPVQQIRPGDVVWFPPGEKHWHGATPNTAMSHIAIGESLDGKSVDWLEKASQQPTIRKVAPPDVYAVAPALAEYTDRVLFGEVWERAELPRRDRSLITVAALIAGGHTQ